MESEPLIQSEEIPQDDVDEEVEYVLEGNFSDRVAEHPLENLDIDRLLVERLGEFGWYQKVESHHCFILTRILLFLADQLPAGLSAGCPDCGHHPGQRVHRVCPPPPMLRQGL